MRRRRAIIYDDETSVLKLLDAAMSRRGYEVMLFSEAVVCPIYQNNSTTCRNEYPCADVIITDFNMPNMTGIELLKKQMDRGCKLSNGNKALISGFLDDESRRAVDELGCTYLSKPFRLSELTNWLDDCERRIDLSIPVGIMRKEKRTPLHMAVHYHDDSWGQTMTGIAVDCSPSGLCLETSHQFLREQIIRFAASLPNSCLAGQVRWSRKMEDGLHLTGFTCCG